MMTYIWIMINQIRNIFNPGQLHVEVFDNPGKERKGTLAVTIKMSASIAPVTVNKLDFEIVENYQRGRFFIKLSQHLMLGTKQMMGPWTVGVEMPVLIDVLIPYFKADSILEKAGKNFLLKPLIQGINIIENVNSTYSLTVNIDIKNKFLPVIHTIVLHPERLDL